eukprot:TRINITY_DN31167_c0_g1_i2.p4 TRINITY_DN31167_c0_g1~~TRINITY_DN31167_c0_g1_i2.p4  ORF type:complete len:124 (+),score=17.60 TRINITY_DN31167_c0_g1_i2:76-447(+)
MAYFIPTGLFKPVYVPMQPTIEQEGVESTRLLRQDGVVGVVQTHRGAPPPPSAEQISAYNKFCVKRCAVDQEMGSREWAQCASSCAKETQDMLLKTRRYEVDHARVKEYMARKEREAAESETV